MSEKRKFKSKQKKTKEYATKVSKSSAKMAYLQGVNDVKKLMELGNVCERTLKDSWLPEFEREKKEILLGMSDSSLKLRVTEHEFNEHLEYTKNLKSISDQYSKEIASYDDMRNSLNAILEKLEEHPDFDDDKFSEVCSMLKVHALSKKAYDTTVINYMKVTNEWAKATGVEAHHNAAAARIKEAERLRGKDDAGRNPLSSTSEGDAANKAASDPFFNI